MVDTPHKYWRVGASEIVVILFGKLQAELLTLSPRKKISYTASRKEWSEVQGMIFHVSFSFDHATNPPPHLTSQQPFLKSNLINEFLLLDNIIPHISL